MIHFYKFDADFPDGREVQLRDAPQRLERGERVRREDGIGIVREGGGVWISKEGVKAVRSIFEQALSVSDYLSRNSVIDCAGSVVTG